MEISIGSVYNFGKNHIKKSFQFLAMSEQAATSADTSKPKTLCFLKYAYLSSAILFFILSLLTSATFFSSFEESLKSSLPEKLIYILGAGLDTYVKVIVLLIYVLLAAGSGYGFFKLHKSEVE